MRPGSPPPRGAVTPGYGDDLAAIHAGAFTDLARGAALELLGRLSPGSRVVDLGCGDGTTARLLTDAGHTVRGIDLSPSLIALARERAPLATFESASFVDAEIPDCDAIVAIGEVLGYAFDDRARQSAVLPRLFGRCAQALRPGGLLMFDLARPDRLAAGDQRGWTEGPGWTVLVDSRSDGRILTRAIVTFRDLGTGTYRRTAETHQLTLHRPGEVLRHLRGAGFSARTMPRGYHGKGLPRGLTAYLARRRPHP